MPGAAVGKEGLLGIRSNGKRSTTRLLDAEFPKFRQLLPAEHTAVATIGVAELTEAIKRVALVADRGAQVRMEFADDVLRLSAGADDVGRADIVGAGRQPQHVVGEFHPDLRAAVRHQRHAFDRLGEFSDADGRDRGVFRRQQLTELREFGVKQTGGASLAVAANTEHPLADRQPGAQRQMHVRAVGPCLRRFGQRLRRHQHRGLDIG